MGDQNGNRQAQVYPLIAIVPVDPLVRDWTFEVFVTPRYGSGVLGSRRQVGVQVGIPDEMVVQAFIALCLQGRVKMRNRLGDKPVTNEHGEEIGKEPVWEVDAERNPVLYPVNSHFHLLPPPPPAEQSRIVSAA